MRVRLARTERVHLSWTDTDIYRLFFRNEYGYPVGVVEFDNIDDAVAIANHWMKWMSKP